MSKDVNYKKFDLNEIQWHKIKGGISKEEFCKGDKKLERIFDALDSDDVKGRLSGAELRAFSEALTIFAQDNILDKKEAKQLRDANGKKLNSKKVFEFLEQLKELQSKDLNLVRTYNTVIDGREVELTEYADGSTEEVSVDGTWYAESKNTPGGVVKDIYENGFHIQTITKDGGSTTIKDYVNDTETRIVDLGNGLQRKTIKEKVDINTTRYTSINYDNTKTVTEYKHLDNWLNKVTKISEDGTISVKYEGMINAPGHSYLFDMRSIDEYINDNEDYFYLSPDIIRAILESPIDAENQKSYISGIINRTIRDASEMEGYSLDNLKAEFDKFLNDELSDEIYLEAFYKDAVKQLEIIAKSGLNGKIDKDFEQGSVGDCYLLAVIKSLSLNPETLKELNDCINIDSNGNARVTLKGVGKTYTITKEELSDSNYSFGDDDVRAIEIAVEKYLKQYGDPFDKSDFTLDSGYEKSAYFLLTGKHAFEHIGQINDRTIDNLMQKGTLACVSIQAPDNKSGEIKLRSSSNDEELILDTYHSYTVAGADKDNVYLINPWDTSTPITLTREEFKKHFNYITLLSV